MLEPVHELLEHDAHRQRRPAAQPRGPEQRVEIGVRRRHERDRRAVRVPRPRAPPPRLGDEPLTGLELVHDAERHVAERRVLRRRHHRDRDHARLEARGRRPGAVDGIDHEDRPRQTEADQPAVLGVEADVAGRFEPLFHHALGDLVDRERRVAAGRPADARAGGGRAEQGVDRGVHVGRHVERERVEVGKRAGGHAVRTAAMARLVDAEEPLGEPVHRELVGAGPAAGDDLLAADVVVEQRAQRLRQGVRVAGRHEQGLRVGSGDVAVSGDVGRDDRGAGGHRLEQHDPERLAVDGGEARRWSRPATVPPSRRR